MIMKRNKTLIRLGFSSLLLIALALAVAGCAEEHIEEISDFTLEEIQATMPATNYPDPSGAAVVTPEAARVMPEATTTVTPEAEDDDYPLAVLAAVAIVVKSERLPSDEIEVVTYQSAQWPDGCLGLSEPGEACTLAIVPGWLIIMAVDNRTYEIRTDEMGEQTRWRWEFRA
jgi:hypothetical protein